MQKLQIKNLTKIYDHPYIEGIKIPVLVGLNEVFPSKTITVIYGPSGSGKSTFIKVIRGIERLTAGEIRLNDELVIDEKGNLKREYTRKIAYIDQFPERNLYFTLSPFENVLYSLRTKCRLEKKKAEEKVFDIFDRFEIRYILHSKLKNISSGELQRVALAATLVQKPKILLCDEPTSKLDLENKKIICDYIKSYSKSNNVVIIVVTHNRQLKYNGKGIRLIEGRFEDDNN